MGIESVGEFRVGLVMVGDELVDGTVLDLNGQYAAERLTEIGAEVVYHLTTADRIGGLSQILKSSPFPVDHIIVAGGLGPTEDDRTRTEFAKAAGVELGFDANSWCEIQKYLSSRGVSVSDNNRRQAFFPESAELIANPVGTAPGFALQIGNLKAWALPGVPSEFRFLFDRVVSPALEREIGPHEQPLETFKFFSVPEAELDDWISKRLRQNLDGEVDFSICARDLELTVRAPRGGLSDDELRESFGVRYLGAGAESLCERLVQVAGATGQSVALAESVTGGLAASRLVDVPGASRIFRGGVVAYTIEAKRDLLGITRDELARGVVSASVAAELARGARERFRAEVGGGITGEAGPQAHEDEVGRCFMAIANSSEVAVLERRLGGERGRVRSFGANCLLHGIWVALQGDGFPAPWNIHK